MYDSCDPINALSYNPPMSINVLIETTHNSDGRRCNADKVFVHVQSIVFLQILLDRVQGVSCTLSSRDSPPIRHDALAEHGPIAGKKPTPLTDMPVPPAMGPNSGATDDTLYW